jgi:hypothetical protein
MSGSLKGIGLILVLDDENTRGVIDLLNLGQNHVGRDELGS